MLKPKPTPCLLILIALLLNVTSGSAQSGYFGNGPVTWDTHTPFSIPPEAADYDNEDLVILNEVTEFYFYSENSEKMSRYVRFKINSQKGIEALKNYRTPESFDFAYDAHLYKQGRRARIKIPLISEYELKTFAARKYAHGRWAKLSVKDRYEQVRWVKTSGEFADEDVTVIQLGNMMVGDVVEIYYEARFNKQYGTNVFYLNGPYTKLNCEFKYTYRVTNPFAAAAFLLPVNIDAAAITKSTVEFDETKHFTTTIKLTNLKANNYPLNSFEAVKMPHVYADFSYYRWWLLGNRDVLLERAKPRNFEWLVNPDTSASSGTKVYDKQMGFIRKFLNTLPPTGTDSQNVVFFKALCDTFNNFRYISANHLFYNESNLYELYSGEHVLKRRLPGMHMWKLYTDILKEKNIFYYLVNVQDKRLGEHNAQMRTHRGYERNLIALEDNDGFGYFMTRNGGLKYHFNELPFYYEGALAALTPVNFQTNTKDKGHKVFKMIKTHQGTSNGNSRTENAVVKINPDSLIARLTITESLSGQYSTVLRHLYLNEYIDSTISPAYFRKCTSKPNATAVKIKLSSKITEYPYRYSFNCSEKIGLESDEALNLHNWFSFHLNKNTLPEPPNQDYYFDFAFTDSYNFLLEFTKPVEIKNSEGFVRNIDNDYFKLQSELVKNSNSQYLLKVMLVVKQTSIPVNNASLLMELVEQLEALNNFSLELSYK